eukprot:402514-Rhodomonas_salina.2
MVHTTSGWSVCSASHWSRGGAAAPGKMYKNGRQRCLPRHSRIQAGSACPRRWYMAILSPQSGKL